MKKPNKKTKAAIPRFRSEDEERDFWATHESTDYFDFADAHEVVFRKLRPSTETISLRLPQGLLNNLRVLANQRDVPYQSLLKVYLSERVEDEWRAKSLPGTAQTETSKCVGIRMPRGFNIAGHDAVNEQSAKYSRTHYKAWQSFAAAWNGVAYHARDASVHDFEFTRLIRKSTSPPPEERSAQESALFGFFSHSFSALECFFFAAYCLGSIVKPKEFPISEANDLKIHAREIASKFQSGFSGEPISTEMRRCLDSPPYKQIATLRNVLTHRGSLPRRFFKGGVQDGGSMIAANPDHTADRWVFSFAVDEGTTRDRATWLQETLNQLIDKASVFCEAKL